MGNQQRYKYTCIIKTKMGSQEAEGSHPNKKKSSVFTPESVFRCGPIDWRRGQFLGTKLLAKPWLMFIIIISPILPQRDLWSLTEGTEHSGKTYTQTFWRWLDAGFKLIFMYRCTQCSDLNSAASFQRSLLLTITLYGSLPNEQRNLHVFLLLFLPLVFLPSFFSILLSFYLTNIKWPYVE